MTISQRKAISLLLATAGKIFSVKFRRRTKGRSGEPPGSIRIMVCRLGTESRQKGGDPAYDFREKKLLPVLDMLTRDAEGRRGVIRSIPLDSIVELRVSKKWYVVKGAK